MHTALGPIMQHRLRGELYATYIETKLVPSFEVMANQMAVKMQMFVDIIVHSQTNSRRKWARTVFDVCSCPRTDPNQSSSSNSDSQPVEEDPRRQQFRRSLANIFKKALKIRANCQKCIDDEFWFSCKSTIFFLCTSTFMSTSVLEQEDKPAQVVSNRLGKTSMLTMRVF